MLFWRSLIFGVPSRRPRHIRLGLFGKWWAFQQLKRLFPLGLLQRHGFVVGRTGSGKSELLKLLFLRLAFRWDVCHWRAKPDRKRTVILLDPHGDLAEQCARQKWWLRHPSLVYLAVNSRHHRFPVLNPFDLGGKTYHPDQLHILASSLTRVFTAMLSKGDVALTLHMRTLLTPMLLVLLLRSQHRKEPSTFFDLARFLDPQNNRDLVGFGMTQVPNLAVRRFFSSLFVHDRFEMTRFALRVRLASLLNSSIFTKLMCQPHSTWHLRSLMESGKTVIINASKSHLGEEVSEIYGRTVMALLRAYAFLRASRSFRRPVYVLVDEAPTFLSEDWKSLLAEARKFGVHAVLAQQTVDQAELTKGFENHILGNTALKVIGDVGHHTRLRMARECETSEESLRHLPTGNFVVKHPRGLYRVRLPKYWLGSRATMSEKEWLAFRSDQMKRFTLPTS